MPISNLCIATNMKYEGGRGVGENILDKTRRQDYWGGTGTPTLAKWLLEFLGIPRIFLGIPRNLFLGIPRNS